MILIVTMRKTISENVKLKKKRFTTISENVVDKKTAVTVE